MLIKLRVGGPRAWCPAPPRPHPSLPQALGSRTSRRGSPLPTLRPQVTSPHLAPDTFWGGRQAMGQTKPSPWGPCNPLSNDSSAHPLIHSFLPSFSHSFVHSLTHSLTHSLITYSFPPSFIHSLVHPSFISCPHSFIHSLIHPVTHSFIHSVIH